MAERADCGRTFARSHDHFDAPLVGTETGAFIDKTSSTMAAVQNRGQFHGAKASTGEISTINRLRTWARDWRSARRPRQVLSPRTADYARSPAPKSETATNRQHGFIDATK